MKAIGKQFTFIYYVDFTKIQYKLLDFGKICNKIKYGKQNRRLATALAHAYDVIEICAPAAPPIRLPIPNANPKP